VCERGKALADNEAREQRMRGRENNENKKEERRKKQMTVPLIPCSRSTNPSHSDRMMSRRRKNEINKTGEKKKR
jgi:hypothetical protein